MPEKRPERPNKILSGLTRDIQAFVRKRDDKREVKATGVRKHLEIQFLISELDNLFMNMNQSDPKVETARSKLLELKNLISRTLHIETTDK